MELNGRVLGRFSAVAFAVLFVLPAVLVFDVMVRPGEAWSRIGRSKWRWAAGFLLAPAGAAIFRSVIPALGVLPLSIYYMARVRSVLDVSTGLALTAEGRTPLSREQQEALAPLLLMYPPVLIFLGIILWTGGTRERLVSTSMAFAVLAVVGGVVRRNYRRL